MGYGISAMKIIADQGHNNRLGEWTDVYCISQNILVMPILATKLWYRMPYHIIYYYLMFNAQ